MERKKLSKQPIAYCPLCQTRIRFRGDIDFNRFNGQVCCDKCETLLGIVISKNKLQGLKVITKGFRTLSSGELLRLSRSIEEYKRKMEAESSEHIRELEEKFSVSPKSDSEKART